MATVAARAPSPIDVYRDDGPLANALARAGRRLPVPGAVLAAAAAVPLLLAIAVERDGASDLLAGIVIAIAIAGIGLATGRADKGGFRWLLPPVVRLTEYAGLLWLGSLAGSSGVPAAFAFIVAFAYRHYDLVYRLRHRGASPPAWVNLLALGWEGRLLLGYVVLPAAFFILAAVLGAVFVAESIAGWTGSARGQRSSVYEEEEDEGQ